MAKQNVCDFENGALDTEFNLTHKGGFVTGPNDFFQARQRSLQIRLRVRASIYFLCVSTIQHAHYKEIARDCAGSEGNLQLAVVEGGTASQRRLLQRLDVSKASGTEANLLGNQ